MNSATEWRYSLDFNERCRSAAYVVKDHVLIASAKPSPRAFDKIQYVEQPTNRDLKAVGTPDMHEAAKIKPVVIDESLVDYESLLRARELGYSGVASIKILQGSEQRPVDGRRGAEIQYVYFVCRI